MTQTCTLLQEDGGLRCRADEACGDLMAGSLKEVPRCSMAVSSKKLQLISGGDMAGGPERTISLSNEGLLVRFCTCIPFCLLWGGLLLVAVCTAMGQSVLFTLTALLSIFTMSYSCDLSISALIGAWRMRKAASEDWQAKCEVLFKQQPELEDVMHIVILPNYKEDEHHLARTLEYIAASPLAKRSIRVVLAMEAREGPSGKAKAARLIKMTGHQFADIFATFHPADLPGDLTGKSSNTQWAYKQMLSRYSKDLSQCDISRVLLSVADADTLWHPQYFSALTYTALSMPQAQRCWSFFQAPMLLFRNLESTPAVTRVTGYATLLFELAGLTNQFIAPAFCFSSYSLTLAMANHPCVDGWDRDVIAEDHHMFCKCYFASIRESVADSTRSCGVPKTRVEPIYLPSTAFLVESEDGFMASCYAKFLQACRHSQGVSEISYTFLQYISLIRECGFFQVPRSAHYGPLSILYKMIAVHMVNQVQAFAVILATIVSIPSLWRWVLAGGFTNFVSTVAAEGLPSAVGQQSFGGLAVWCIISIFGSISPMAVMMISASYVVLCDLLEGRLTRRRSEKAGAHEEIDVSRDVQGFVGKSMKFSGRLALMGKIASDYLSWGHCTLIFYGLLVVMISTTKLMRNGQKCEYIVAAKPKQS